MGEYVKVMLEEEIKKEINNLSSLEIGTDEHSAAVEDLVKLYKLKLDDDKIIGESENKNAQAEENVKDRYVRIGIAAAELVLPLVFYGIWMRRGFRFEETGTYTSSTFRGLFSRFKPTK